MGRRTGTGRRGTLGCALATTLLLLLGWPAASQTAIHMPAKLVGSWTRFVSAADWKRAGITGQPPAHLSMVIGADGVVPFVEETARFTPLSGNRLAITGLSFCGSKYKGVYGWQVSGRHLTLTKVHDTCADAVVILAGVWTRE